MTRTRSSATSRPSRRKRRLLARVAGGAALLGALSGCATMREHAAPTCVAEKTDILVLSAQSVPTATMVPCIAGYPAGWHFASVTARNGHVGFVLDSDRAGASAVEVGLSATCDVSGATEISTDEAGTRRFERVLSVVDRFEAIRSYRFEGGCVTYHFDFDTPGQALVNEVSVAVGFITRSEIDRSIRERSGGAVHL